MSSHIKVPQKLTHRMATEYMEYFAHRSLQDCLLMCGPDLVVGSLQCSTEAGRYPTTNRPFLALVLMIQIKQF